MVTRLTNYFGPRRLLPGLLLVLALPLQAVEFYRYKNAEGVLVIDSHIPPEFVDKGYSIVNENGQLLKKVAPAPTDDVLRAEYEKRKAAEAQRRKDEQLLSRYASVEDIHASRKRVRDEIETRIAILRGSMRQQQHTLDEQLERAANIERAGREVSDVLRENLATLEQEIENMRASISKRKQELKEVDAQYAKEEERFVYLMERRYGRRP
jgi:chromosome segregation ATPase